MTDPETLSDDAVEVPPPFEGEQVLNFDDFDVKEKDYGFWVFMTFHGDNGEKASWSGNFYTDASRADAEKGKGRTQSHAIAWRGLKEFFKATGMTDGDLPKSSPRGIATALGKMVNVNGDCQRVRATLGVDNKGYTTAGRFKAA